MFAMQERQETTAGNLPDPHSLVGQFRCFGEVGPAYEVLRIDSEDRAVIRVVHSAEELTYPIIEIVADPVAETIC
jgi:hypothetical protein